MAKSSKKAPAKKAPPPMAKKKAKVKPPQKKMPSLGAGLPPMGGMGMGGGFG